MKKTLAGLLALLTVLTLLGGSLVSCDEQTLSSALDAALSLAENLPEPEKTPEDDGGLVLIDPEETDPSPEEAQVSEPEPEPAPETEAPAPEPETPAPEPEQPAPEPEAPVPEPEQPAPEPEAPAPEPEQPAPEPEPPAPEPETEAPPVIDENGSYDDKENVALYIHTYGKLPPNYITKKEAENLGWTGGSLERYAPGKCIGGTYFGNYEGLLPKKKGREYHECDIGTIGRSSRGAKRIVYSNDGLIYYTEDHYESFELLYGGD